MATAASVRAFLEGRKWNQFNIGGVCAVKFEERQRVKRLVARLTQSVGEGECGKLEQPQPGAGLIFRGRKNRKRMDGQW